MSGLTNPSPERLAGAVVRSEIEALVVECAYLLDRQRFDELVGHFTEDCEVTRPLPPFTGSGTEVVRGRDALAAWYRGPAWPNSPRTMRHVVSNLRIGHLRESEAAATLCLTGYRYEGAGVSLAVPMTVGDYEDLYRHEADGVWRIHRRRLHIGFLNQELLELARSARDEESD